MSTIGQGDANAATLLSSMTGKHVCPFCGTVRARRGDPCPRCTMEDTAETRQATRNRIGPWYVLQSRNPSAPGMKFDTLLLLVRRGQVTPRSIVRGPTTHQLWRFAIRVRGLSREWGLCYSCGQSVESTDNVCTHCHKLQEPPLNPDMLLETPGRAALPPSPSGEAARIDRMTSSQIVLPVLGGAKPAPRQEPPTQREPPSAPTPRLPTPSREPSLPAARSAEKILSPKDLAAAFSLDFKAAAQAEEPPASRSGRRIVRVIGLLLVVGILALIAALALNPPFRRTIFEPISRHVDGLKAKWHSIPPASTPATAPSRMPPPSASVQEPSAAPAPVADLPALTPPTSQKPSAPPDQRPLSLQDLPLPPAHPVPSADLPSPPADAKPAIEPPPTSKESTPSPQTTEETASSPIDRSEQVRQLWIKAIDAEGHGDLAGAIRIYEQIKTYPSDLWPVSLELRLEQAKKQLK
jgi:hypothetical protein